MKQARMRITGGIYAGRRVSCPKGVIRPAMDRMRESLFSILGDLGGCSFLDLFAGSGIVGIEAASRGAAPVTLVEKDGRKKEVIRENISMVESEITLHIMPVERFRPKQGPYSVVYLDPPFKYVDKPSLITMVQEHGLLREDGVCIIHHPSPEKDWPARIGSLACTDIRGYGGSSLRFFRLV